MKRHLFTSESVTEGHPDKMCDQISDAVLDEVMKYDVVHNLSAYRKRKGEKRGSRVACETFVTVGLVVVGGEITTKCYVDIPALVRSLIKDIGYTKPEFGFEHETCAVLNAIGRQSPDIALGVDTGGAGDQGSMFGYACRETKELMPLPIMLAHGLTRRLAQVRRAGILDYLGPDGKSQVTIEYRSGKPFRVDTVVLSTQHTSKILNARKTHITDKARAELINTVIRSVIPAKYLDKKTKYFINPTGKFLTGGPKSDTGMTGRKIIVDTYGGRALHGGGAFSGKDPTKVDRSATYMARYIAKNLVAARIADECTVQLAYAIGVKNPVSVMVDTYGTGKINEKKIVELVKEHFSLTPEGIIRELDLWRPIYRKTACYGHLGREGEGFIWEKRDKAETLRKAARL
ncbi:methionine adenosyltransferase [bacterium]|nr:methionine adenosyltransferase [bacterium]